MIVYIAGPITGSTMWDMEQNVRVAEAAWWDLCQRGIAAICPHTMCRFYHQALSHSAWMDLDYQILERCQAMLVVGDAGRVSQSKGVQLELAFAADHGIPVFYNVADLARWVTTQRWQAEKERLSKLGT